MAIVTISNLIHIRDFAEIHCLLTLSQPEIERRSTESDLYVDLFDLSLDSIRLPQGLRFLMAAQTTADGSNNGCRSRYYTRNNCGDFANERRELLASRAWPDATLSPRCTEWGRSTLCAAMAIAQALRRN
jgi:hypothetical protein